jgi:hypothetical protein
MRATVTDIAKHGEKGQLTDDELSLLQFSAVLYFLHETNPDNGLVREKTHPKAPASIAALGMALATIPIVVERAILLRDFAVKITRKRLRYLLECAQGPELDASGYKGFFYRFLDIETGRRVGQCEVSTADSAILFAGALTAATYFDADTPEEAEVRSLANALYRRADWNWARDGGPTLTHGWRPETGFTRYRHRGFDDGLLLYILGLGSPTHPLPAESYPAYCATYRWKKIYDRELLCSGPLFAHQLPHLWIDFRGIRDEFMRAHGSDYFENSRQATFVQQEYAVLNPQNFAGYGERFWGFTTCDGPGKVKRNVEGVEREFFDYGTRGAPFGPDDGTIAPWAVVSSLPFAPELVLPTLQEFRRELGASKRYGLPSSFNASFSVPDTPTGCWVSPYHFGIHQGPVVLMIENYRTGLLWNIMRRCPAIVTGLIRAGFHGGWL